MNDTLFININPVQAREILLRVPVEYQELVAVTSAVLACSTTYICPFCTQQVSVDDAEIAIHRRHCKNAS